MISPSTIVIGVHQATILYMIPIYLAIKLDSPQNQPTTPLKLYVGSLQPARTPSPQT